MRFEKALSILEDEVNQKRKPISEILVLEELVKKYYLLNRKNVKYIFSINKIKLIINTNESLRPISPTEINITGYIEDNGKDEYYDFRNYRQNTQTHEDLVVEVVKGKKFFGYDNSHQIAIDIHNNSPSHPRLMQVPSLRHIDLDLVRFFDWLFVPKEKVQSIEEKLSTNKEKILKMLNIISGSDDIELFANVSNKKNIEWYCRDNSVCLLDGIFKIEWIPISTLTSEKVEDDAQTFRRINFIYNGFVVFYIEPLKVLPNDWKKIPRFKSVKTSRFYDTLKQIDKEGNKIEEQAIAPQPKPKIKLIIPKDITPNMINNSLSNAPGTSWIVRANPEGLSL